MSRLEAKLNEFLNDSYNETSTTQTGLSYRSAFEIESKPIRWLWKGRIARGKVSMLAGNPGLGKSQVTASMASIVSTGACWPVDRTQCDLGTVIILSAEDDPADTIRPRLEAAGADLKRVVIVDADSVSDDGKNRRSFNLKTDIFRLEETLAKIGDVALLIIDPISAYLGQTDDHKNAEIRALLSPLSALAAKYELAVVCVSHFNKGGSAESLMRITGSLAFVAAARAAYAVLSDPDDKTKRLFLPIKNNIGNDRTGLAFRVQGVTVESPEGVIETSRILWESEIVTATANEVLASDSEHGDKSATDEAVEWLKEVLSGGPIRASEVLKEARHAGISERSLKGARQRLKVKPYKGGLKDGWFWALPLTEDLPSQPEEDQNTHEEDHTQNNDLLRRRTSTFEEDHTFETGGFCPSSGKGEGEEVKIDDF